MVDYVFVHLEAIYGYLWTGQSDDPRVIIARAERWEAVVAGLKRSDIRRGLDWCTRNSKRIPSPAEFREMCLPSATELGLPEPEQAYQLVARRKWDHTAVYHTWRNLDQERFRNSSSEINRKMFFEEYQKTINLVRSGGTLAQIPIADLPSPPITEEQLAHGRKMIDECRVVLMRSAQPFNQEATGLTKQAEFEARAKALKDAKDEILQHRRKINSESPMAA